MPGYTTISIILRSIAFFRNLPQIVLWSICFFQKFTANRRSGFFFSSKYLKTHFRKHSIVLIVQRIDRYAPMLVLVLWCALMHLYQAGAAQLDFYLIILKTDAVFWFDNTMGPVVQFWAKIWPGCIHSPTDRSLYSYFVVSCVPLQLLYRGGSALLDFYLMEDPCHFTI